MRTVKNCYCEETRRTPQLCEVTESIRSGDEASNYSTIVTELVTSIPNHPRIVMDRGQPIMKCQIRLTLELTYALGWIVGDGYANRREIDAIVSLRERSLIEPIVRRELERFGTVFVVPRNGVLLIRCNSTLLSRALCSPKGTWYWENRTRLAF